MAGILVVGLLVAGCGGGGSSSGDSGEGTITKAEFVKKANAICKEETQNALAEMKNASGNGKGDPTEIILASYSREIEGIEALGAPKGDEAQIEAMLRELDRAVVVGEKPNELIRANELVTKSGTLAEEYGLSTCPAG